MRSGERTAKFRSRLDQHGTKQAALSKVFRQTFRVVCAAAKSYRAIGSQQIRNISISNTRRRPNPDGDQHGRNTFHQP